MRLVNISPNKAETIAFPSLLCRRYRQDELQIWPRRHVSVAGHAGHPVLVFPFQGVLQAVFVDA